MLMSLSIHLALPLLLASFSLLIAAATKGATDPLRLALKHLQNGVTWERRQAAERLGQMGDQPAAQPSAQGLTRRGPHCAGAHRTIFVAHLATPGSI